MKIIDYILSGILEEGISHLVTSSSDLLVTICDETILNKFSITQICDERSTGYVAIGLYEEIEKPIAIIVEESEMRNLAPAVTEAYYRKFPLIVISLTDRNLDNRQYPIDMFRYMYNIAPYSISSDLNIAKSIINSAKTYGGTPILLNMEDYKNDIVYNNKNIDRASLYNIPYKCERIDDLIKIVKLLDDTNVEFYIDKGCICYDLLKLKLKGNIEYNKGVCALEGLLSIMIGASLVARNKHFIYLGTTKSVIYDINALGNRHISKNITICLLDKNDDVYLIKQTCKTWKYDLFEESPDTLHRVSCLIKNDSLLNPSIIEIL